MKKINIDELTDMDFENFSKDILSYKLGINMRTFRKGRDKGIDAISLGENDNWIMQAKFPKETTDSTIKSTLKKESQKVKKLKPERYFLFIGKELTVSLYEEIIKMFSPYLKPEDLYDEIRIKDILEEKGAEFILEKWDKLWLPSPYFAQKYYEKFKNSKYDYKKQEIINEARIFVETEVYKKATKILQEKNIILIHGQPGVGKTMLARRIALKYIYKGYEFYFENAINIKEIENYIYDGKKRVIIIDDFLGESTLELKGLSDNKLYDIIQYAKKNNNIKLILTTRSYIYNNAKQILEKFSMTTERLEKLLVEVSDYTDIDKAKILYNHLYYNNLLWSIQYLEIVMKKYYTTIIYHKNFTPRNIEQICEIIKEDKPKDVTNAISQFLDNPEKIWSHEYDKLNQSNYGKYEKILLDLVCFLKYEVEEEILKEQFQKVISDESEYDEYIFYKSLEELSTAFISSTFNREGKKVYKLSNPSMGDFLRIKAKKCKNIIKSYILNMDSVEGIHDFYDLFSDDEEIKKIIEKRIEDILEQNIELSYFEKRLIGFIFEKDLTKTQETLIRKMVDDAFEKLDRNDITFILDILEIEHENSYMYEYMLKKFKEYEIEKKETRKRIIHHIGSTFDWNTYLGACKKALKRRNSKYLMEIKDYMIIYLVDCIEIEAEELMGDYTEEIARRYRNGEDLDKIIEEFIDWSLSDLENLWKVYTEEIAKDIIEEIKINCYPCLDEEEIENEKERIETEEESEDREEISTIFDKNLSKEEILYEYLNNNITKEEGLKKLAEQKEKWYIQEFLEDKESIEILIKFLNKGDVDFKNAVEFGQRLVKYLLKEDYKRCRVQIEDISYETLRGEDTYLDGNIQNDINQEIIEALLKAKILIKENNEIRFLNEFFIIYFGINKIQNQITLEEIIDKAYEWQGGGAVVKILNMYSYTNLEKFNKEYLLPNLYYYKTYIRKNDKYAISKSLIRKLEPNVYISKYQEENGYIGRDPSILEYIGIDFGNNLGNFSYWKIKEFLGQYYSTKSHAYEISYTKIIENEKAINEFNKILVWEYFENVYKQIDKTFQKISKNTKMDAYYMVSNQETFGEYLDKDKRENRDKYSSI